MSSLGDFGVEAVWVAGTIWPAHIGNSSYSSFTAFWNDFLTPLLYLNDDSKYTLSLGLQQFNVEIDCT